jgi:hypothetical protein
MSDVLFINHAKQQCGVHQFGKQIFDALKDSQKVAFAYHEIAVATDLPEAMARHRPQAVIVNWHPATELRHLKGWPLWSLGVPVIGLMHDVSDDQLNDKDDTEFDYYIWHAPSAEITNPLVYRMGRLIQPAPRQRPPPRRLTFGSFGFAGAWKNFEGLVARIHAEFDDCLIRLNIPSGDYCDSDGSEARKVAERCRAMLAKPGVELEVTHHFWSVDEVIDFLAGNTMNVFFYQRHGKGISSAMDLALAARRPLALVRDSMARHLFAVEPSIFVEDRSLREILETGVAPLLPFIEDWSAANIRRDYEAMIEDVLARPQPSPEPANGPRWLRRAEAWEREMSGLEASIARLRDQVAQAMKEAEEEPVAEGAGGPGTPVMGPGGAVVNRPRPARARAEKQPPMTGSEGKRLVKELRSDYEAQSRALRIGLGVARQIRALSTGFGLLGPRRTSKG